MIRQPRDSGGELRFFWLMETLTLVLLFVACWLTRGTDLTFLFALAGILVCLLGQAVQALAALIKEQGP